MRIAVSVSAHMVKKGVSLNFSERRRKICWSAMLIAREAGEVGALKAPQMGLEEIGVLWILGITWKLEREDLVA